MYEYSFKQGNCWYSTVCRKYGKSECNSSCIRYQEMDYLMSTSNIPKNRQYSMSLIATSQDAQAFYSLQDIKNNIIDFTKKGENLYIYSSNFGNGKTSWAIKIMQSFFNKIWAGNGFQCRGIFIHVPAFLTKIKEGINRKDDDFEQLKSRLSQVDLVIWDDIAATKLSDYDHLNLLTYIDSRNLNGLANIFTGNLAGEEIKNAIGNRLASRVWNNSTQIEIVGADRRGMQ